jgi:protein-S-isoprenylcysteine O-methyltransferase Ste14
MVRLLAFAYGVFCYLLFLVSFLYAIGFAANVVVPKGIDDGAIESVTLAAMVDLGLLSLFAIQHSVMARPAFKQWWVRYVAPPIERSTYVLFSSLVLLLLFWLWRPLPESVWHVTHPLAAGALWAVFGLGWAIVLGASFLISHFDLFGLRQVYLYAKGQPYESLPFQTPGMYRLVRHPLMVGFVLAFWATPTMTQGHLLFAFVTTAYILVAVQLEERDLVAYHGDEYAAYQNQVRMLLPLPKTSPQTENEE